MTIRRVISVRPRGLQFMTSSTEHQSKLYCLPDKKKSDTKPLINDDRY